MCPHASPLQTDLLVSVRMPGSTSAHPFLRLYWRHDPENAGGVSLRARSNKTLCDHSPISEEFVWEVRYIPRACQSQTVLHFRWWLRLLLPLALVTCDRDWMDDTHSCPSHQHDASQLTAKVPSRIRVTAPLSLYVFLHSCSEESLLVRLVTPLL